ncbi:MAG TPA: hypothetical protein VEI58_05990 [Chthoniobacterales bacterium]|nr:hypothetical protein [Chthoniobacterales bacterium]
MAHDPVFDSTENQALLVVCARKTIRTAALVGIVWGVINLVIAVDAIRDNILNVGLLGLALLMLGTGVAALMRPSLHALLAEAIVSVLLFSWNVGVTALNASIGHTGNVNLHSLILPALAAVVFFKQYSKLGHLKKAIETMDSKTVQEASGICKQLFKTKLKESVDIAEASSKRCRLRFMSDSVFCVQRNLTAAFHLSRADFQQCIADLSRPKLRMVVRHPLGKVTYGFNKKNSAKIKSWLCASALNSL